MTLDVEDLRLGNVIEYKGNPTTVWAIHSPAPRKEPHFNGKYLLEINAPDSFLVAIDECNPMPFSDEIFEKLGFKNEEEFMGKILDLECGVSFGLGEDGVMYYWGNIEPYWVDVLREIKYIHEFQNLVHSITRHKIIIK